MRSRHTYGTWDPRATGSKLDIEAKTGNLVMDLYRSMRNPTNRMLENVYIYIFFHLSEPMLVDSASIDPVVFVFTPPLWPVGAFELKTAVDFIDFSLLQGNVSVTFHMDP